MSILDGGKMEEIFKDSPLLKKHIGKCALCGKEDKMSFEHIPPRAAFNSSHAKPVTIGTILKGEKRYPWDIEGLKYVDQQGGMGVFSLCEKVTIPTKGNAESLNASMAAAITMWEMMR